MTGIMAALVGSGGGGPVVTLYAQTILGYNFGSSLGSGEYRLTAGGKVQQSINGGSFTDLQSWVDPLSAAGGDYEARMSRTAGASTNLGESTGVWYSLGSSRTWGLQSSNFASTFLLIEVRSAATQVVLSSAAVQIEAEGIVF
tara:strand:+ start:11718 stop:12146 length:429 start_codon:yes stop_codon:yes gene_type:complete